MSTHIRVSEILAQFRNLDMIPRDVLNTKGEIGTEVHGNIHAHNLGQFPLYDMYPHYDRHGVIKNWSKRGEGYFDSYLMYDRKENPRYANMEKRFYCDDLMLTGQVDAIRYYDDKLPVITDFKCSASVDEEIWSMQAHYYKYLTTQAGIETADYMQWIQLKVDKNGNACKPNIITFTFDEFMMSRCINEAILIWERKKDAKIA